MGLIWSFFPFSPRFWCGSKQFQPPTKKAHHRAREWSTEARWGIGNLIWILMLMIMLVMIVKLCTICSSHLCSHPPIPYVLAEVSKEQFKIEDWENSITACNIKTNFTSLWVCFVPPAKMTHFSLVTVSKGLQNLVCSSSKVSYRKFLGAQGILLVPIAFLAVSMPCFAPCSHS